MKKIKLTRGFYALVDDEDYLRINKYKWYASKNGYARRDIIINKKKKCIHMHREIIFAPKEKYVDHINLIKNDNRKNNLRLCNKAQNSMNRPINRKNKTSKYKGVYFCRYTGRWRVRLRDGKQIEIGRFDSEIDAAIAYNHAAKKYFGEFSLLNIV